MRSAPPELASGNLNREPGALRVGAFTGAGASIDELTVWDRSLSVAEVKALHGRGARQARFRVRSCQMPSCADGPFTGTAPRGYLSEADAPTSGQPRWSPLDLPRGRYFRYEMTLGARGSRVTPFITEVRIDFER